jgi:hypothetical protein
MSSRKDEEPEESPVHSLDSFPTLVPIKPGILRLRLSGWSVAGQVPISGRAARSIRFNVARLSERSIDRYNSARAHFEVLVDDKPNHVALTALMECTDSFEDLISSLHRGFMVIEAVRRNGKLSEEASVELSEVGTLIAAVGRLRRGMGDGAAFLAFDNECVYVGDASIEIEELGRLVRALYSVACSIVPVPTRRWIKASPQA